MLSEPDAIKRWLIDIRHRMAVAEGFAAGMVYESFAQDMRTIYAVTRRLESLQKHRGGRQII